MSHSWQPATTSALPPDAAAAATVADALEGYRYQVAIDGDRIDQVETRGDDPAHRLQRRADYLVGSGRHALALVSAENGYLTQLPLAWFRSTGSWRMNPGYELKNHRFSRPITPGCIACHGTEAVHEPPAPNRFVLPIPAGIACRRCHGEARRHVAYWSGADKKEAQPEAAARLVHPARLPPARANDLCLQCHLQGDVTVYRRGRSALEFSPGDDLREHRHDFLVALQRHESLGVASHGARMLGGRCYTASQGRLTCILCHDAHRPAGDVSAEQYDRKCATCHTPESCAREVPRDAVPADTGCVACHMPQRAAQEGIHLVFTDHAIVRHAPPPDRVAPPPPLPPPDAEVDLVSCWPGEEPPAAVRGAAYVLFHEAMGPQKPALRRGRQLLSAAVTHDPADQPSRYYLASAQLGLGAGPQAVALLRELLQDEPAWPAARYRLALAYELAGDAASAIEQYERLRREAPGWSEPYPRLAQLYLATQRPAAAVAVLRQQLSYQADPLALAQLALARRLQGDSHAAALAEVTRALQLDPRSSTAYLHRATLFLLIGENDQAAADFQRVLRIDPGNAQALQALEALSNN